MEDIIMVAEKDKTLEQIVSEYDENIHVVEYREGNKDFCLLCDEEVTKLVLYVRRDYIEKNGKLYYVELHAVKSYKSFEDCEQNIDGDLHYYAYGAEEEYTI